MPRRLPVRSVSPIVRSLATILRKQGENYATISRKCGFDVNGPSRWVRGIGTPNIITLEILADFLGYEIILRKKQDGQSFAQEVENSLEQKHVTGSHEKPARAAGYIFGRTKKGPDGKFMRWEV